MSFSSIPTEVVELILIFAAAANSPETVAAFSQTCRAHKELVYGASDNHLWREIFLTTFDDPRETGGGPGWREANAHKTTRLKEVGAFDWGAEYRKRIWTAHYVAHAADIGLSDEESLADLLSPEVVRRNLRALDAMVGVIQTARPCPPSVVLSFIHSDSGATGPLPHLRAEYPTFPPLPVALRRSSGTITVGQTSYDSEQLLGTRNIPWLKNVLAHGYPPSITARFSAKKWEGGVAGQFLEGDEFREMQAAGHLIACTGFIPIPRNAAPPGSPVDGPLPEPPSASFMSEEAQRKRARKLARMRVYNMRYLGRERCWGPFLPYEDRKAPVLHSALDDELLQPILALFHPGHGDEEEDEEDVDYQPEHHHHGHEHDDEDGEEGDADEEDEGGSEGEGAAEIEPATVPDAVGPAGSSDTPALPSPAQLRADWAYLAAVRTLVEANLREAFGGADLEGLFSLDGLRPGSAPLDASHYKTKEPADDAVVDDKGKGKEVTSDADEVEGWDWAGVTGVWQRCVCWMDYRDLILHNLSGEFDDSRMGEAVRLVGMTLRVASYSRSCVPGYEHLPTINVVGESDGASIVGQPRKIHGTVGVIADGSVRWSLFSSLEGGGVDEWSSEGVQVGGVGSEMGVLGMWTGAQHERMDPLGPTWAWKVG